jgi:hypothetical protein
VRLSIDRLKPFGGSSKVTASIGVATTCRFPVFGSTVSVCSTYSCPLPKSPRIARGSLAQCHYFPAASAVPCSTSRTLVSKSSMWRYSFPSNKR